MSGIDAFDSWLTSSDFAAVVLREPLMPVEGRDGVIFPATFASGDNFPGGYNIDDLGNGRNVCLIDSMGSQANRIEPLFKTGEYATLVPQLVVEAGEHEKHEINLLDAGHRAGDAIMRCSELQPELQSAFKAALRGDAEPLARIAPTSLVFGAWDSRDTQAKVPRAIASTIRAYNVRKLTRSAQYIPAIDYVGHNLLDEATDEKTKKSYAERGYVHVPSSSTHGGVIAEGGIRREATLHLGAIRLLAAAADDRTLPLQRYVLGLSLLALSTPATGYLRQGCTLVTDPEGLRELALVGVDGIRHPVALTPSSAFAFARLAAVAFGVGPSRHVPFLRDKAQADARGETKAKKGKKTVKSAEE